MSMHDILKKIALIENREAQEIKPQNKLEEKYMGFDKTVAAIKKSGSAENPEAVAAAIGRKKYGKEKFQKAAAAGKKLGETQDLAEEQTEESALQAYLGKKKYGEQGMKALQKAGREGASKEEMAKIRAKHDKMDEQQGVAEGLTEAYQSKVDVPATYRTVGEFAGELDRIYEVGDLSDRVNAKNPDSSIGESGGKLWFSNRDESVTFRVPFISTQVSRQINAIFTRDLWPLRQKGWYITQPVLSDGGQFLINLTNSYIGPELKQVYSSVGRDQGKNQTAVPYKTFDFTMYKPQSVGNQQQGVAEGKSKPDFLDVDKDGNRKESFKKAVKDKETVKESWTDFEDAKRAHEKAGSTVTGRPDDYTVTMMDGTRKRFITKDSKRRVETLPPVQKRSDDEEDTPAKSTKKKETKAAAETTGKRRGRPPGSKNKKISEMTDHEFHGMITYYKLMESELSDEQKTKKEEIAKAMKDSPEKIASLKKRYGKRWKNVVFATATKKAKETVNEMLGDGYFIIFTGKDWDRAAQGPYRSKEDAERANPAPLSQSKIVNQNEFAKWKQEQVKAQKTPKKSQIDEQVGTALSNVGSRAARLFKGKPPSNVIDDPSLIRARNPLVTTTPGQVNKVGRNNKAAAVAAAATAGGLGILASRRDSASQDTSGSTAPDIDYSQAATDMQGTPMSPNAAPGGLPRALDQIDQARKPPTPLAKPTAMPSDDARSPDGSSGLPPSSNRLPAATAEPAATSSMASSSYQVGRGDTLSQIAQRNNTSVRELLRLNPEITNPDVIRAGQKINVAGAPQSTYAGGVGSAADTQSRIAAGTQFPRDQFTGPGANLSLYTPSSISDLAAERAGIKPAATSAAGGTPEITQRSSPVVNATQTASASAASNNFMDPFGGAAQNTFDTSKIDTSVKKPEKDFPEKDMGALQGKSKEDLALAAGQGTITPDQANAELDSRSSTNESIGRLRHLAGLK